MKAKDELLQTLANVNGLSYGHWECTSGCAPTEPDDKWRKVATGSIMRASLAILCKCGAGMKFIKCE